MLVCRVGAQPCRELGFAHVVVGDRQHELHHLRQAQPDWSMPGTAPSLGSESASQSAWSSEGRSASCLRSARSSTWRSERSSVVPLEFTPAADLLSAALDVAIDLV